MGGWAGWPLRLGVRNKEQGALLGQASRGFPELVLLTTAVDVKPWRPLCGRRRPRKGQQSRGCSAVSPALARVATGLSGMLAGSQLSCTAVPFLRMHA